MKVADPFVQVLVQAGVKRAYAALTTARPRHDRAPTLHEAGDFDRAAVHISAQMHDRAKGMGHLGPRGGTTNG